MAPKDGKGGRRYGSDADSDSTTVVNSPMKGKKEGKGKGKKKDIDLGSEDDEPEEEKSLATLVDRLTEKRVAERTSALGSICEMLRGQVLSDDIDDCQTMVDALMGCIRKGGSSEGCLASTALSLLFITLAEECSSILEEILPALGQILKTCKHAAVRGSVAEAIGVGVFSAGDGDSETLSVMGRLAKYMIDTPKEVVVSCLKAWGLLASAVSDAMLVTRMADLLQSMETQVDSNETEVRMAAAENVALLYEACWRYGGDAADEFCGKEEPFAEAGLEDNEEGEKEGGQSVRRISKAERARERIVMRNAMKTVEGGAAAPVEKLKVKGTSIVIDTWRDKKRLAALRKVLQGGLQTHLVSNAMLHEVFRCDPSQNASSNNTHEGKDKVKQAAHSAHDMNDRVREKVVGRAREEKGREMLQSDLLDDY